MNFSLYTLIQVSGSQLLCLKPVNIYIVLYLLLMTIWSVAFYHLFICTFCSVCDRKSAKCNFQSCGSVLSARLWKMMMHSPNCDSLHASLYRRDPDTIHRLFKCWKCTWWHAESGNMAACSSLLHYLINYLSHNH